MSENKIVKSTVIGSISGGTGYILTLPLDSIKQNIQSGNKINFKNINYFKGGYLGLSSIIPQMAIKFSVNSFLEQKFKFNHLTNGFIAGFVDGAFLGPLLISQSLLQMNNNMTYSQSYNIIKKNNNSLLQLSLPMAFRNGIYTSILIGGYKLIPNKKETFTQDLYYASLLNIPGTMLCSPADVIRAKQAASILKNQNINILNITKNIYKEEGILGFFKGYKMLYINFALRFPITLAIFNYLNRNF